MAAPQLPPWAGAGCDRVAGVVGDTERPCVFSRDQLPDEELRGRGEGPLEVPGPQG